MCKYAKHGKLPTDHNTTDGEVNAVHDGGYYARYGEQQDRAGAAAPVPAPAPMTAAVRL